jgi:ribosomal protein S18 acetylase RimI-like enzyme
MTTIVRHARFPEDTAAVLSIWREFVANTTVSLAHQNYEAEFTNIPGKYAPPEGRLLLAERGGEVAGCVAFRKVDDRICEMKRLYVRPGARGEGLGRRLAERLLVEARKAGYEEMRLDVLAEFENARNLYADLGFAPAEPIAFNPLPGTDFLGLKLR